MAAVLILGVAAIAAAVHFWNNPIETQVEKTLQGYFLLNDGSTEPCEVSLTGVSRHYYFGNELDSFDGCVDFSGKSIRVFVEKLEGYDTLHMYYSGSGTDQVPVLIGWELDYLVLQCYMDADAEPRLLVAPAADTEEIAAQLAYMEQLLEENPGWNYGYDYEWWNIEV
ncbi:MAG: hypothetical protein LUJ09_04440 [Firmicutes bacterium]|nr:hypothetical protein [Bacillota bacterium]